MTAMARVTSPRLMRGAIIASVLVHLVVFVAAARVGFARGQAADPAELVVFNVEMARAEQPERVEITPEPPAPEPKVVAPKPSAPPVARPEVEALRKPPKPKPKPREAAGRTGPAPRATDPPPNVHHPSPRPAVDSDPNAGGGGGDVNPLVSGRGEFPIAGAGGTGPGGVPGTGTGSGSGSGTGTGTGSGSGTGSGTGPGHGGGVAPPPPPPPPPPKVEPKPEPKPDPPHVSRLADRKLPVRKHVVHPTYPAWAQEQGIEGTVTLELTVTEEGKVDSPRVVSSTGNKRLDEEALKAIRKWTYEPAVQDGKPRTVRVREKIRFRLG